jgi:hypothetical protein
MRKNTEATEQSNIQFQLTKSNDASLDFSSAGLELPSDSILYRFYSQRFKSLEATISTITGRIEKDELIDILRQDPVSEGFTVLRMSEIIQECMQRDRELFAHQFGEELRAFREEMIPREQQQEYVKVS